MKEKKGSELTKEKAKGKRKAVKNPMGTAFDTPVKIQPIKKPKAVKKVADEKKKETKPKKTKKTDAVQ